MTEQKDQQTVPEPKQEREEWPAVPPSDYQPDSRITTEVNGGYAEWLRKVNERRSQ